MTKKCGLNPIGKMELETVSRRAADYIRAVMSKVNCTAGQRCTAKGDITQNKLSFNIPGISIL